MTHEFGPRLRQERERRKISLESISANTKVGIALFEGLERDDVSRWPSGIFRRSFMRAYAGALGIDAEAAVREFLERFPDPADLPPDGAEVPAPDHRPKPGLRLTLADSGLRFIGGRLLPELGRRSAAVALDAAVISLVGIGLFLILGQFWVPVAVFMVCYYWGGILLLGNTPGVCLQAPTAARAGSASAPSRRQLVANAMTELSKDFWRALQELTNFGDLIRRRLHHKTHTD
jgi:transcriptional regulator with XRE-family HTH domain